MATTSRQKRATDAQETTSSRGLPPGCPVAHVCPSPSTPTRRDRTPAPAAQAGKGAPFTPTHVGWTRGRVGGTGREEGGVSGRLPLPGGGRDGTLKGRRSRTREPRGIAWESSLTGRS